MSTSREKPSPSFKSENSSLLLNVLSLLPLHLWDAIAVHLLLPEELGALTKVSKSSKKIFSSQRLWQEKFAKHFPRSYQEQEYSDKAKIDWYKTFKKAYQHSEMDVSQRKWFSLLKEGRTKELCSKALSYASFSLTDADNKTLLQWAQERENQTVLNYFYSVGARDLSTYLPHKKEENFFHQFCLALECKQPDSVLEELLDARQSLTYICPTKGTLLHQAIKAKRSVIILKQIVNKGVSINLLGPKKFTPLCMAAEVGLLDAVDFLLSCNVPVNTSPSPLTRSLANKHWEVANALLKSGRANIEAMATNDAYVMPYKLSRFRNTVLHQLASENDCVEGIKFLLDRELLAIDIKNGCDATPLHVAAVENNVEVFNFLLAKGADLNARAMDPDTGKEYDVMHFAALSGSSRILRILLKHGKQISQEVANQLLLSAVEKENLQAVKFAFQYHADIHHTDQDERTALHLACKSGAIAKLLVDKGAYLEVRDKSRRTPYQTAVTSEVMQVLLARQYRFDTKYQPLIHGDIPSKPDEKYGAKLILQLFCFKERQPAAANVWDMMSEVSYDTSRFFSHPTALLNQFKVTPEQVNVAAQALKDVVFADQDPRILENHQAALSCGELGYLYEQLQPFLIKLADQERRPQLAA